ncbi:MAG TPA: hypothetical protein PLX18_05925 [Anaerohalosphaeraceae bacterium]|nr:hypothetical protein [Anaerohalosphaeraceae bacterium]HOT72688.1 hypothetical protein [Anaerohalosphaeraceae bacterium]HQG05563.1 hypothetical protein [Anaerohalosphaeraceae bacterium]HQI07381.1 hypothetical protein [Anaerohalosphaeraceae bacterium]HQJ67511.1 hypothetical protein [Anaerohalosphaeraceae bacterium]
MKCMIQKRCGFLTIEMFVTLALLMMLFVLLTDTLLQTGRLNRTQWAEQMCLAAVQAQLDSLTARGKPLDPADCRRLWPAVDMTVQLSPGEGPWAGLTKADVQAEQRIFRKTIRIRQSRYLLVPQEVSQ